jgi:hypothetical protein
MKTIVLLFGSVMLLQGCVYPISKDLVERWRLQVEIFNRKSLVILHRDRCRWDRVHSVE